MDKAKEFMTEKIGNIEKPEASILDVDLKDVGRDGVSYLARICIVNPYGVTIPVGEITYILKSADRFQSCPFSYLFLKKISRWFELNLEFRVISSGKIPDPGSLEGNDKTTLEVRMKVPHSVCVSLVKDIGADWDIDYSLEIGIIVDLPVVGNFTIPLTQKGEMKLPSLKDFF